MAKPHAQDRRRIILTAAAGLALATTLLGGGGCAKDDLFGVKEGLAGLKGSRATVVDASDFGSGGAPAAAGGEATRGVARPGNVSGAPVARADVFPIGGVRAAGTPSVASDPSMNTANDLSPGVVSSVGTPSLEGAASSRGGPATVDAVVGQINGRPVFVSEVLEPLDGKLRALARAAKDNERAWTEAATMTIEGELNRLIEDELILSEARASLSPEQKAGLFRFLKQIEGELVSRQHGSEVGTDEKLREETGRGLRQEAEDQKDKALITNELRSKVTPRVMVRWRDVQNEYERRSEKYNPPAQYVFRMVYTDADKSSSISQIQDALSTGKSFEEMANLPANDFNRREGGVMTRACADAQADCTFSPVPELNTALRSLGVGQTLGPIIYSPNKDRPGNERIAWVYLEKIERPQGKSLYDAQLEITDELRVERSDAEVKRYFARLLKRGNVSNVEGMRDKLLAVATDRYAPQLAKK